MSKPIKRVLLPYSIFIFILVLLINNFYAIGLSSDKIHPSNETDFTFSGNYNGNISVMYFDQSSTFISWNDTKSGTQIIPYNYSRHGYNYEYRVNRLDIRADVDVEIINIFTIANKTSEQISLKPAYRFAQEFTAPDNITSIEEIMIYFNYNLISKNIDFYYLDLYIYDESLQNELDWVWIYDTREVVDEWISFEPKYQDFEPNQKYNIVFRFWVPDYGWDYQFDLWKAENYTNPSFNKGITRYYNYTGVYNSTYWAPHLNDSTVDMLCYFAYKKNVNWNEIGLEFKINNNSIIPEYEELYAFSTYTATSPLTQDINVTVKTRQTIALLSLYIDIYYIYLISANGTYHVDQNVIEWIIEYNYENIPFGWPPPQFLFEKDWDLIKLMDPNRGELSEIYFGPTTLYNESYYGITTFFGPPLEGGNYTGKFSSPNYCSSLDTKVKSGHNFVIKPSVQLGQTIKLEAKISNHFNQPISGGIGNIVLLSPDGDVIYNETNLTSINGTVSSSELPITKNYGKGNYEAIVIWVNGKEVAYYSVQIIVVAPVNILFWIIISIILAAASTPVALVARKYIKQMNWQKTLKNLFVFTKEGLSLYEYSFGIEIQDPALISAMIAALTNFVKEATGSKEALRTVDQEDKKVILYHGNHTITAIMSDRDLPIIHKRVQRFSEAFENEFGMKLKQWTGELTFFKSADVIVNKCFPIDVEGQIIRAVKQKLIELREKLDYLQDPKEIISMMREITEFISKYRGIVNRYYIDYYNEIIRIAEEKISS